MTVLPLSPDELLSTTRSVRKRLDLTRSVPMALVRECVVLCVRTSTPGSPARSRSERRYTWMQCHVA